MKPRLPSAEEWRAIQGGAPTLLVSPSRRLVEIIHAYRTANETQPYAGPLAVVPTPIQQLVSSQFLRFDLDSGPVHAPAALLWAHHGQPCERQSGQGSGGYQHLHPALVDRYIERRQAQGWQQFDPTSSPM